MQKTFIGIDLHKDSLTYCVLNENGEELEAGRIAAKTRKKIVEFVKEYAGTRLCVIILQVIDFNLLLRISAFC